jgi:aminopeptidase YwaD
VSARVFRPWHTSFLLGPAFLLGLAACGSPSTQTLRDWSHRVERLPPAGLSAKHGGPGVAPGGTGTARFARPVYQAFRADRAMETAAYADGFYREPGNEGFEAVIDRVRAGLEEAGFGTEERLRLEVFETPMKSPAWTPRRGRIALLVAGEPERTLHEFNRPEDRDRTMLPRNAPSARVEGPLALRIEEAGPGSVLVTEEPLSADLLRRARDQGAAAVLSASLAPFNVDPTGKGRHLDAIQYSSVGTDCPLPVAKISPRSLAAVRDAAGRRRAIRIAFEAEVEVTERPLRTLVATVVGTGAQGEAVVLPAHVQEPGACDNASGVATMLEDARVLAGLLQAGDLEPPARSIAFVWGQEMEQSRVWLAKSGRTAIAAVAADMTGESKEKTGAVALLERMPDPGAVEALPPDQHTPWGAEPVAAGSLAPDGLAIVARCAMIDVGALAKNWITREHPYEGGSDHAVFLGRGVPAVLFWHFTDFAYHTSLDRLEHVDAEEMHRTGSAILATALALADARPTDLQRYLESLKIEQDLRLSACATAGRSDAGEQWKNWFKGARLRLADLCLGRPREAGAASHPKKPSGEKETP